jgi:DNA-binding transcriptional MerR regulator
LGEKSFKRRDTVHGNEEESRQEKETLSEQDARPELPQRPPERSTSSEVFPFFQVSTKRGCRAPANRARNASTDVLVCHGEQAMSPRTKPASRKHRSADVIIPDKLYFRIGEVARLCRLHAYVLRFWETEFPQLKPVKSSTGQRMYRRRDVESVLRIKKLLYEDGFTIAGARGQLREEIKSERDQSALPFPMRSSLNVAHLRHELREILHILSARR